MKKHCLVTGASGRSDIFLKLEFVKKALIIAVILITFRHGVLAMVIGQAILSPLCVFVNAWPNRGLINYTTKQQIRDVLPVLILSIVMGWVVLFCGQIISDMLLLLLVQIILGGGGIYFWLSAVFRLEAGQYVLNTLRERIPLLAEKGYL